jgi:hypothetical protein
MYDEFDFDLMSETTYTTAVCVIATCIIAVLIITPIKKRNHGLHNLDHHLEETAYPVFHEVEHEHYEPTADPKKGTKIELTNHVSADDIPIEVIKACASEVSYPAKKVSPKRGTKIELLNHVPADDIPIEVIKACASEVSLPARTVPKSNLQSPIEEAIHVMKKSRTDTSYGTIAPIAPVQPQQQTLRIPLKFKTAEITLSPTTLGTLYSNPNTKYGSKNMTVEKMTIKCHFAKSLLIPTNKYTDEFVNIIAWLATIGYKAPIDLVIQQDSDIEFDQKAVNARQAIMTTHIATLKAAYTVNQTYGIVTPKATAKAK